MKNLPIVLSVVALLSSATTDLCAQAIHTGYLAESYLLRHQLNPAYGNNCAYFSLPVLGATHVDLHSNFGVKNIIFEKSDGSGLTTFMHPEVSPGFIDDIEGDPNIRLNLDMPVVSVGFKAFGGYNTIESGLHVRSNIAIDRDLLRLMKHTSADSHYNLGNTGATAMGWTDISLGHSRQITEQLRIGAKVKALLGIAYADADLSGTQAHLCDDEWMLDLGGHLRIAGGGVMTTDEGSTEMTGYEDFTPGVNGFGMAVDLGATYQLEAVEGLTLSAALTDLGYIKWDCQQASPSGQAFVFSGFDQMKLHDDQGTTNAETGKSGYTDGTIDEQWERIGDDFEEMSRFYVDGAKSARQDLGTTLNLGAEYKLPLCQMISFGLLYSQRLSRTFDYTEARVIADFGPGQWFDLALSADLTSYGAGWGALLSLKVPGFSLHAGLDRMYIGSVNSDGIPLDDGGLNVSFGINVPLK
ncbi:MAG: DUF5723 family protein [Bacteroidales bacterium]|nr:DUF5723 family protein [Bacteroidales bacterium]